MSELAARLVGEIPLFAGLEASEVQGIVRICQRVIVEPNARLMRQGQPAESAFILESGTIDVMTLLPGGGEAKIAEVGAGNVLGEMALLEGGTRSATVVATTAVTGYFIERDDFRVLLAQRDPAVFVLQSRITRALCRRLRELNSKIVASEAPESPAFTAAQSETGAVDARRGCCGFDYRRFLPLLPVFRRFGAAEIEAFAADTEVMEIDRGGTLFQQGETAAAAYIVVRGALEIAHARDGRRHRIGVLGPGRLCGVLAVIEGERHSMSAGARENSVLLEIGKPAFDRFFTGNDRIAAKFQDAVKQELVQALARTNNQLTRLISQARIRGRDERRQADELQRALGAQDCPQSK